MKVKILVGVRISADFAAAEGEIVEVDNAFGTYLIGGGRAEKYVDAPAPKVEEVIEEPKPAKVDAVPEPEQVPAVQEAAKKSKKTEK